ncbi:hypothetical protein [Pseudomonas sp. UBA6310]|nr:hypothetical protein [Pseudomonas sp. UBA6310]
MRTAPAPNKKPRRGGAFASVPALPGIREVAEEYQAVQRQMENA